ncbi:MAG TPA: circadian clock protein KaiC [Acidimicrobiales bacterium]|nr:circadian clock protein KaiC [Acidimicrobiales bacterium]
MTDAVDDFPRGTLADDLGTADGANPFVPAPDTMPRLLTGIRGFDQVTLGGVPAGRSTLVTGPAGSGKTVMAGQFLAEGARRGEPGVFVTFEESADDLRRNLQTLGWPIAEWEAQELWRFVDGSPVTVEGSSEPYNFDALLAQIGHAVDHTAPQRISLDSLNVMLGQLESPALVRYHLRRLAMELRRVGLTSIMTLESDATTARLNAGFEQFVADNVVLLRNSLEDEKRRRTIEVLKMRGAMHRKGEYPFTVLPGQGLVVIPLSVLDLSTRSTDTRISSGNKALDELCHGGLFRDSIVLVSGATGSGKTLMVTEFLAGAAENGERALLFAFEESREQIFRNARGWGKDFAAMEEKGLLKVISTYPEVAALEDHLVEITRAIEAFRPARLAIDSLSALERSGTNKGFREFLIVLSAYIKAEQLSTLFTATSPSLIGGSSVTEGHVSALTDSIILLRYAEVDGEVRRGLTVLKMRGSAHDKRIHEFTIGEDGMRIIGPFRGVAGILSGHVFATDSGRS